MKSLFTKTEFRTFLEKNPDMIFIRINSQYCPLARFLEVKLKVKRKHVCVQYGFYEYKGKIFKKRLLPLWAIKFVGAVDRSTCEPGIMTNQITGRRALEILNGLRTKKSGS